MTKSQELKIMVDQITSWQNENIKPGTSLDRTIDKGLDSLDQAVIHLSVNELEATE